LCIGRYIRKKRVYRFFDLLRGRIVSAEESRILRCARGEVQSARRYRCARDIVRRVRQIRSERGLLLRAGLLRPADLVCRRLNGRVHDLLLCCGKSNA
jgi:hypothetical protein